MADQDSHDAYERSENGRTVVALFASRAEGREAIGALHKAHYKHTWLGTTRLAETQQGEAITVESGRGFFSGTETLVDALVSRGIRGEEARALEGQIEPGNALVTVDPKDDDREEAADILRSYGARVGAAETRVASGTFASNSRPARDDAYDDVEWEEIVFYQR